MSIESKENDLSKSLAELGEMIDREARRTTELSKDLNDCRSRLGDKSRQVNELNARITSLEEGIQMRAARIAELERKAKAFDEIRELFDRFDTRFAGARDQVLLTDELLERTRDAISAAVAAKESNDAR